MLRRGNAPHEEMHLTQLTQAGAGNRLLDFPLLRRVAEGCRSKGKVEFSARFRRRKG